MLQISTGKFFRPVELHETLHRAVFFTNYQSMRGTEFDTPVGKLLLSTGLSGPGTITCETVERLEAVRLDGEPETMISTSGAELLDDVAAVISFALDITCTRDHNLTVRLVGTGEKTRGKADHFISRTFDPSIFHKPNDGEELNSFLTQLIALERKSYERAMRAIRRYVLGMHRIVDEDSLAYSLFVMSIEALQDDAGTVRNWGEVNSNRRTAVDKALAEASPTVKDAVQSAIIGNEKASIGPRFIDYVMARLSPSYFREEAADALRPISKLDLPNALKLAYAYRSRYVHSLKEIPANLRLGHDKSETSWVDGQHALTFQGITRLARHVIGRFVEDAPKPETEEFAYRGSLPNIVYMPMAPQYWIWRPDGYNSRTARYRLTGFLSQVAGFMTHSPKGPITDLTALMQEIERQVPGLARASNRLPMLITYILYNLYAPETHKRPDWRKLVDRYPDDFSRPSIESVAGELALRQNPEADLGELRRVWDDYLKQRVRKQGLMLPQILEAAFLLSIAEKHREAGDLPRALAAISEAVEIWPASVELREYEAQVSADDPQPISWPDILIKPDVEEAGAE